MGEAASVWARIGIFSFGGPAGQIALMHHELVERRRWLDERQFLAALNFCMLLPGPEAMQLATYAGWRMHGVAGGLVAGLLFFLPGALLMLGLALAYLAFGMLPAVVVVFMGIKAAVLAIVLEALVRVGKRTLRSPQDWLIAAAAFLGVFALHVPFPILVVAALAAGYLAAHPDAEGEARLPPPSVRTVDTLRTILLWLGIWILPLLAIAHAFGTGHVLSQLALFFSKLAIVTFGGAYAVLTYMAQTVVDGFGWLTAGEMLDALGLAETTPGPLILVTEFVGILAAARQGGGDPVLMGLMGALVTLWATFAPCFLWIFAGAPYLEWLTHAPRLAGALRGVTAAVVGVIFNLTLWFALHVVFGATTKWAAGPLQVPLPVVASFSPAMGLLSLLAVAVMLVTRSVPITLAVCAAASLAGAQMS